MCGIAGVITPHPGGESLTTVRRLNVRQHHRGPDDTGLWSGANAVLGQTRLAVMDLTDGGHQPFTTADGSVSVVFNGEIYNHDELRRTHGLTSPGRCDGAILPELWQRLGTAMFAELRGMFAMAIYDTVRRTVTLARDTFGVKPLYWLRMPEGLVLASEVRPLADLVPRPRLSRAALRHYLMFGAMGRDQSPFTEIQSVPANGWIQWDANLSRTAGVVRADPLVHPAGAGHGQLRAAFLESVSLHLLSDVPMALLLSSGLDSGALAWACAELGTDVTCVTVDMGSGTSESPGAARLARRFGHDHEVASATPDAELVARYFAAMQRPSVDGLNVFLVSRAVAALGRRAALSGTGGDEMLAGYPSFKLLRYLPLLRAGDAVHATHLAAGLYRGGNAKLANLLGPAGPRSSDGLGRLTRRVLMDEQIRALAPWAAPEPRPGAADRDGSAGALAQSEIDRYLGGTLLPDTDAFSMAWSVEMRVPFVDVEFARVALSVDRRRGVGKRGFARALGSAELDPIARGRKKSFHLPMDGWMRTGPLSPAVQAVASPEAPLRAILDPRGIDEIMAAWRSGRTAWSRAWSLTALNSWLTSLDPAPVLHDDPGAGDR
ncbi:asparagine synthase (glutamine-hydrolyzing) [Winogradskya humida]|uniref:asparagine synthase (glutamine-hydrolyzing) n=1 Tax=Winogradskya humida TaxID=113566 RepID=A0ABQ3ZY01_9ACTN|nr:asparagine synthase (glutamine-hydrolyzing) [Actinoplanes humidus]GIE23433.1 asparagine synthetase B [Actinoplanes humidus]